VADKIGHVVLRDGGSLVAHAGWLPIEITIDARPVLAVGLGGVLVHRSCRGRGLGAVIVTAAMERMRELGRPMGLLFCHQDRVAFYERLGWRAVCHERDRGAAGGAAHHADAHVLATARRRPRDARWADHAARHAILTPCAARCSGPPEGRRGRSVSAALR